MAYRHLDSDTINVLANRYGLEPTDRLVIESAKQADEAHGRRAPQPNWGTDRDGYYQAANLLDGYLDQIAFEHRCDERADRDFRERAYGE